ncbi:MAG: Veg family protein [Clostridia bacterium]|nr:Veg family protein [Clostridia bacterium]
MGICRSEIADLKKSIGENIGQKIIIKESPGKRSKPQEKVAVIENTYNSYFRVKFEDANRVGSYNYTDLFTRNIEVRLYNGEEYEPILPPQVEVKKRRAAVAVVES